MENPEIFEKIQILYEDEHLLAIDKPSGLVVHSDGKTDEPSVADWLMHTYPKLADVGEPWKRPDGAVIPRPGIVHRIDRDTSGVLLVCKDNETFAAIKKKFQNREMEKSYYAFVYGEIHDRTGIIDRPIARSRKDFRLWSAQRGARGEERDAVTAYAVLQSSNGFTFVEARPKTGRTHQIRVHLKAINHPVICDRLYAPKREAGLGFTRLALHAAKLSFSFDDRQFVIESPMPEDFQRAFNILSSQQ